MALSASLQNQRNPHSKSMPGSQFQAPKISYTKYELTDGGKFFLRTIILSAIAPPFTSK
jgi:hypothetical protein